MRAWLRLVLLPCQLHSVIGTQNIRCPSGMVVTAAVAVGDAAPPVGRLITAIPKLPGRLTEHPGGGGADGEICAVMPWRMYKRFGSALAALASTQTRIDLYSMVIMYTSWWTRRKRK